MVPTLLRAGSDISLHGISTIYKSLLGLDAMAPSETNILKCMQKILVYTIGLVIMIGDDEWLKNITFKTKLKSMFQS